MKSQKNVGIGVRNPVQKFQVQGTSAFSDRIGIGTVYPSSRIHAIETSAVIPTLILENNAGVIDNIMKMIVSTKINDYIIVCRNKETFLMCRFFKLPSHLITTFRESCI